MKPYATQAEAAAQLREFIANEDEPPPHRYVAIIHHVTSPRDVQKLSDRSMSRSEYELLAGQQRWVAARRGYQANYSRGRRSARATHGNKTRKKRISEMSLDEACRAQRQLEDNFRATFSGNKGHGNSDLQTGKFYAYRGHRVWLDAVPGGYFAMVEGTAIQARAATQGEALKKLREKLDKGDFERRRHGNAEGSYRVAYLMRARRTLHDGAFSRDAAIRLMKAYKRRGMTAWMEDTRGAFVPVPGAKRRPQSADHRHVR